MDTITVKPKTGLFAGKVVQTNSEGRGIFTREACGIRQHRGTYQTPKFTTPAQLRAYLRRNYPSHTKVTP